METVAAAPPQRVATRLRLPPAVRTRQILDAALAVFSERGYAAARMDDIAAACRLSKGGLYAHFASKERVFEALIARALVAPDIALPPHPLPMSPVQLVDWLLEQLDARIARPELRATLRLLVAEGERVPALVAQWHGQVIQPFLDALGQLLAQSTTASAPGREPLLVREPWLVVAPALHGLLMQMILPPGLVLPPERLRLAHRELLLQLLDPRPTA